MSTLGKGKLLPSAITEKVIKTSKNRNLMFKFDCGPKRATVVYRETCKWGAYNSTNSSTRLDFLSVGAEERDWNKRAVWENGWGRSDRSEKETEGSRRADVKANLTHLPRIPAPSDTINTFILSVLLSGEMKPQRSASGQKEAALISLHSYDVEGWKGGAGSYFFYGSHTGIATIVKYQICEFSSSVSQ